MRSALVCGAGGFIGGHLVKRLKAEGFWIRGADLKNHEYAAARPTISSSATSAILTSAAMWSIAGLTRFISWRLTWGAPGSFLSARTMPTSCTTQVRSISTCWMSAARDWSRGFSIRPRHAFTQPTTRWIPIRRIAKRVRHILPPQIVNTAGKSFSASACTSLIRAVAGSRSGSHAPQHLRPRGYLTGGREKAPAALCRKVAETPNGRTIDIWGDGNQTRSFLYVSECVEGTIRLMRSGFAGPVNVGSDEMVTINQLANMIMAIAGKRLETRHITGPLGVRGRNSDNRLIEEKLGWKPEQPLSDGLAMTYEWIERQVMSNSITVTRPQ